MFEWEAFTHRNNSPILALEASIAFCIPQKEQVVGLTPPKGVSVVSTGWGVMVSFEFEDKILTYYLTPEEANGVYENPRELISNAMRAYLK